jgi:1-acyl-sn-glycerol-3-phosphate acyltransferase
MTDDILGLFYMIWPLTITCITFCFIGAFVFVISFSGFLAGLFLIVYYGYYYLKDNGYIDFIYQRATTIRHDLLQNLRTTFVLRGHLDTLPKTATLFVAHPHGLFFMGPFFHWAVRISEWPEGVPRVHPAIHSIFFRIPIVREIMEAHGAIEATEEAIENCLRKGESVMLMPGGIQEIQKTSSKEFIIFLKKRRGYLRIAKRTGVPIVPVLTTGETELFVPMEGQIINKIHESLKTWFGLAVPIPTINSLWKWFGLFREPLPNPVETWIGRPIFEITQKNVLSELENVYTKARRADMPERLTIQ